MNNASSSECMLIETAHACACMWLTIACKLFKGYSAESVCGIWPMQSCCITYFSAMFVVIAATIELIGHVTYLSFLDPSLAPSTSIPPPQIGSCVVAGFTGCCTSFCLVGNCFCDFACHRVGDCCEDIDMTCPSIPGEFNFKQPYYTILMSCTCKVSTFCMYIYAWVIHAWLNLNSPHSHFHSHSVDTPAVE